MALEPLAVALALLAGAVIGSFLNVVVHRVPLGLSLVRPASACPQCEAPVRPADNIPVLSYVLLRGRCRHCRTRISPRYPLIEALTALLFAGAVLRFERPEEIAFVCAASAVLVALAFIDLSHRRVPNKIVLPATAVAAVWVTAAALTTGEPGMAGEALGSGAAGFALLFVIALVSGGMGFGDVKLAAFIGIACGRFGWEVFVLGVFAAFIVGGVVALALLLAGRSGRKDAIPFAPMLCAGALIGLYAGEAPVQAWLGL